MKTKIRALLPLLLPLAACSAPNPTSNAASTDAPAANTIPLVITSKGKAHRFDVETAVTPQEQAKGLMFRKDLPADGGMVFPMKPPQLKGFWMENMVIPIDMLFVAPDGTIARVAPNRKPHSREPASAGVPVAGVLELRGGRAAELGIKEGDTVQWGACAASEESGPPKNNLNFCP